MPTLPHSDPPGFETLEAFSNAEAINRWMYETIKPFISGSVLEIGGGIGNISSFLLADHARVTLSDLREEYCEMLRKKFAGMAALEAVYELDLSSRTITADHPELSEKFDTIIALNVIEHIENDLEALQHAKSMLKKNGRLIVLVPAGQWLYNRLDRELGHFKRYDRATLKTILYAAGLKPVKIRHFNAAAIAGWFVSGNLLKNKTISSSKLNLYNRLVPVFRVMDWFITPFTGVSVISIAVKI